MGIEKNAKLKMKLKTNDGFNSNSEHKISSDQYGEIMNILHDKNKPENSTIDLIKACKEAIRMYDNIKPVGGWQGVYEMLINAVKNAEAK